MGAVGSQSRHSGSFAARVAVVLLAVIALTVSSLVSLPAASWAKPNAQISISDVTAVKADGSGTPVKIGDSLTVHGTWDAIAAQPAAGDTFSITLPKELVFAQALPFQLLGGENEVWADCLTDPATSIVSCTMTDIVTQRPELVSGEFEFDVKANAATDEKALNFDLNGKVTPIEIPGGNGIGDGIELPTEWKKSGSLNDNKWSMSWVIEVPGSALAGNSVVNVRDVLGDNHVLCSTDIKVETVRGSDVTDVSAIAEVLTEEAPSNDFTVQLTAPEGGFNANVTYRLSYQTCTLDQQIDPKGTVYDNEAFIDVLGPQGSGVIGVEQNWQVDGLVVKRGSVSGGADRNGVINWTVEIAGDQLLEKNDFTFSDVLEGSHALCTVDGQFSVKGLKISEKYGPSGQRLKEITADQLSRTVSDASAQGFTVDFAAQGDFAFKASDYIYVVNYQTCATTDGLPAAGTEFTNTATVDGLSSAPSIATVPGVRDSKSGNINGGFVTIGDEQFMPQTTMNWNITVPGAKLQNLDSAATVIDELSETMQVCAVPGKSLAESLGLSVRAVDQVNNGGLATVDLTDTVQVAQEGRTLTFEIPQPELTLPNGEKATGFSHEYQYVITYTTCTTSGGMDAPGTEYSNTAEVAGKSYTHSFTQENRGSGTGRGVTRGSVSIEKLLADTPGADYVADGTEFKVHVKEYDPKGVAQVEYDLQVPLNGDRISGPNSRGTGWTAELSELEFPSVAGVTFGAPKFAASEGVTPSEDGATATVALVPGTNINVSLTNQAELGSLTVTKEVLGGAADLIAADEAYTVTAQVDASNVSSRFGRPAPQTFTVSPEVPYTMENLPVGAVVNFEEVRPATTNAFTWAVPEISPKQVEVPSATSRANAQITVTNRVERTVGTFSVVKQVTGAEAENEAVPATVEVTASWNQEGVPGQKVLTVPTDGTAVALDEQLLIGTEVTLSETALPNGSGINWGAPSWIGTGVAAGADSTAVVTIGRDADAQVTLQNHAATSTADLQILKQVTGAAGVAVDADTEYTVRASWTIADGRGVQTKDLVINAQEPTNLGVELPANTEVTLEELERPEIHGVDWGTIAFAGDTVQSVENGIATILVSDMQDEARLVTLTNEATWSPGTFSISKAIAGISPDHADYPSAPFTVIASWVTEGEPQSTVLELPVDGTVVDLGFELPYLTEVLLTEAEPDATESFSWGTPEWAENEAIVAPGDGTAVLTIGAAENAELILTNNAEATLGEVSVTKELVGTGAAGVPADTAFPVTAQWTDLLGDPQERELEVTAGKATVLTDMPLGTEVTFTEGDRPVSGDVHWVSAEWSTVAEQAELSADGTEAAVTVSGEAGDRIALTLTNEYEEGPAPENPVKEALLAVTGGNGIGILVVLGAVLLTAGAWLVLRRRRQA